MASRSALPCLSRSAIPPAMLWTPEAFWVSNSGDRLVIRTALTQGIPVAIVLAGGYAQSVEDTITIHANTAAVAKEVLEKVRGSGGWRPR